MSEDPPLTERRIAKCLMRDRYAKHTCLPCYTPDGWWENDVFMLTDSGYWWEFEIKLTLSDFRRDAEKARDVKGSGRWEPNPTQPGAHHYLCDQERKHELLATGERGPTCFYYVAPVGVIPVALLPAWAGLIEIHAEGSALYERPAVKAPRRHGNKAPDLRAQVFETCYWRYHRLPVC